MSPRMLSDRPFLAGSSPRRFMILLVCWGVLRCIEQPLFAQATHTSAGQAPATEAPTTEANPQTPAETAAEPLAAFPLVPTPPLRRAVLYNSGVGQMQYGGKVNGNARIEIKFSGHDVDDVLKSLVFQDQQGGKVRAVEYLPAPNAEAIAARTFQEPLTLAQLLQVYRGESVVARAAQEVVEGTIFGVETREEGEANREILVLSTEQGFKSFDLQDLTDVRFDNEKIREELRLALSGVAKSREADHKRLQLLFEGTGEREIGFAYVVDSPIWRLSYRAEIAQGELQLQGWAHVNNTTGLDWEHVELELRSGLPMAFHAELFAPLLAERRDVGHSVFELPNTLPLISQWFGMEPPSRFADDSAQVDMSRLSLGGGMSDSGGYSETDGDQIFDLASAFAAAARQERLSGSVRLRLTAPVSLESGKSASLPVIEAKLPVSLLTVVDHAENGTSLIPQKVAEFKNSTSVPLIPGPVSVSEQGTFVGDAQLNRVPLDETTRLVYALDRPIQVTRSFGDARLVLESYQWQDGELLMVRRREREVIFALRNTDTEARVVEIVYQLPDDELEKSRILSPNPDQLQDGEARFRVELLAHASRNLTLVQAHAEHEPHSLAKATPQQLQEWLRADVSIADTVRQGVNRLADLQDQFSQLQSKLERLEASLATYVQEQTRVRANLEVVQENTAAAEPYFTRLREMEDRIQATNNELEQTRQAQLELQQQRATLIELIAP